MIWSLFLNGHKCNLLLPAIQWTNWITFVKLLISAFSAFLSTVYYTYEGHERNSNFTTTFFELAGPEYKT
jgi:hypothetical protein